MRTLILNGSPRLNGDTAALVAALRSELSGSIDEVNAYHDRISPCIDCRVCWQQDVCAIDDGMQDIYRLQPQYDAVVIASPIYFSNLSGSLLALCSRFQFFWVQRVMKGIDLRGKAKRGAILLTGGGDDSSYAARKSAAILLHQLNATVIGEVMSLQTNNLTASEDIRALKAARELGRKLGAE